MKATLISKEKNVAKFTMEFSAEEFENAVKSLSVGEYTKEAVYSPNYELYYVIYRAQ